MSLLGTILGGGVAEPIKAVGAIVDDLFTSDEEKLDKEAALMRLAQRPALVQAEINRIEARHRSVFVAGWRPFIGWVCGAALAYSFVLRDFAAWVLVARGFEAEPPPELAMEHLMTILMALLGLGGFRTFEKLSGRAK